MVNQLLRAGRLDRSFYTSLLFDDYATGNAVALVALMAAIPVLLATTLNVVLAAAAALGGLIRAGLVSVAAWAIATRLLGRDGRIPTTFRLTAFAHVALAPLMFTPWLGELYAVLFVASMIWFFFAMRIVAEVQFDLRPTETPKVAAGAVGAMFIAMVLF